MMRNPLSQTEFDTLKQVWSSDNTIPMNSVWHQMNGGRSNAIWRIEIPGRDSVVCKLFLPSSASPMFANDGTREALILAALDGSQIAPKPIALQECILGISLVYQHLAGSAWCGDITTVAKLMANVHQHPFPKELPTLNITPTSLRADTFAMLQGANQTFPSAPYVPNPPKAVQKLLHGDIVPGNIIETPKGLRLIDWQCPSIGDPSSDIAVFLSPAMQVIYGHRILTKNEIELFLTTYERTSKDDVSVARYRALKPLYHWRMAAYCLWKATRGDHDYAQAVALELAQLDEA